MSSRRLLPGLLTALLLLVCGAAQAGQSCEEKPLTAGQLIQGMELAQATAQALDASGAEVVVLARAGQDLSAYGLQWSHAGFAYREVPGVWRVLHKLNQCGTARGDLFRQGLGEFFLDRPYRYAAAYAVLNPELQQALLPLLRDNARSAALQEPRYSMVAYAWGRQYQQSNQWLLETLASVAARPAVYNREQAQAWLKAQGYAPTVLHLSAATRLGARMTMAHVAFDDHPNAQRYAGQIATVTADSLFAWLSRSGLGQQAESLPK